MLMLNKIEHSSGNPYPLGATKHKNGWNFAIYAKEIKSISFLLFDIDSNSIVNEILLDTERNRTGNVWHLLISNLPEQPIGYAYSVTYPNEDKQLPPHILSDPFAQAIHDPSAWGEEKGPFYPLALIPDFPLFDWEDDKSPHIPMKDSIIYEMHVRGFTQHQSSHVANHGSYLGIIEKIPHLVDLGVTAVELLPIHEFNECEYIRKNPISHENLYNYWGYSTVNVFSPMQRYASSNTPLAADYEFKAMVKALHKHGIEVILDVVFNHTAEGSILGPIFSYKGLDPNAYYMINSEGKYLDFSGCGNTFNCSNPIAIELIIQSLRFWVTERHVDGFRFDLATILMRDSNGNLALPSPLLKAITLDPILADIKLIAEPWDAGGLYRVGSFAEPGSRWAEWNGSYRDDIRSFIRGDSQAKNLFATRLCGSPDIYGGGLTPSASINFVTCHDGFSLNDLTSYNHKHNFINGENNQDGTNDNRSWNCGTEGPSQDALIINTRQKQKRNFHVALMLSKGIPLVLMGDEYGHTKLGNNNTWCQDNELNWFLWDNLEENRSFYRFYKLLIQFRKNHPQLQKNSFLNEKDIIWHGSDGNAPKWDQDDKFVAYTLIDLLQQCDLYVAFNASKQDISVILPNAPKGKKWHWIVATHHTPPDDFYEETDSLPATSVIKMPAHSSVILKAL